MALQHHDGTISVTGYTMGVPPSPHDLVFILYPNPISAGVSSPKKKPYLFSVRSLATLLRYLESDLAQRTQYALEWTLKPLGTCISSMPTVPTAVSSVRPTLMNMGILPLEQTSCEMKTDGFVWVSLTNGYREGPLRSTVPSVANRCARDLYAFIYLDVANKRLVSESVRIGLTYDFDAAVRHTFESMFKLSGMPEAAKDDAFNDYTCVGRSYLKNQCRVGRDCPSPLDTNGDPTFMMLRP